MHTHNLTARPRLRFAVPSALTIATIVLAAPSTLLGQTLSLPSCAIVAERQPTASNVVWGNWVLPTLEDACVGAPPDDRDATDCGPAGTALEWFWDGDDLQFLHAIDGCCGACGDDQASDGEPATAMPATRPELG